ncbi:tRNA(Ile)(2)-agmatinylcytidine synthase [Halorubellus sp. PRR65]|uniref:tRNA(Ile)(2)-agmatinylcytidine synthase n=1 Tax=Halorubellus sp. PRR65 TaxID=3098148 RepID=UPI002B2590F6|nr:tRNA(Ile)(2)-agmatinylcytidine synthase [Halorubellus sp. PRR65]
MTVVGVDDTDSRVTGMCTTYVAHRLATALREREFDVARVVLVRLNPAVPHKTRGNAALAVHTDAPAAVARDAARDVVERLAQVGADGTNPGVVVAAGGPGAAAAVPDAVAAFASDAVREFHDPEHARGLATDAGYLVESWGNGRGVVGALASVGAWRAFDEWTTEHIAYRERGRWGTDRDVDADALFAAADDAYPGAWDTVDGVTGDLVAVPRTPCPILLAVRGDDPGACRRVVDDTVAADGTEPVRSRETFVTNQGTDAHLRSVASLADLDDDRAYRVQATVAGEPETRRGGHVFVGLAETDAAVGTGADESVGREAAAFEPTKHFRDRVRSLMPGDRVTVCGEVSDGTLKLEKFALRERVETTLATPDCPDCGRSMKSAGRDQGYRCRDCSTSAPGKVEVPIERDLERGWYEVPPCARRHLAKPLVRGGFDAPTHPER